MAKKELTDKQKLFVEYMFGEADGDPKIAAEKAGYSTKGNPYSILRTVAEEILKRSQYEAALTTPKCIKVVREILDEPGPGASVQLKAAEILMDRGGLPKQEAISVDTGDNSQILVLPPKKIVNNETEGE